MKCFFTALSCAAAFGLLPVRAETLTIFANVSVSHAVPRDAVDPAPEGKEPVTLTVQKKGAKLGAIDTGANPMVKVVADAKAYDGSGDPFYGPGVSYLAEDDAGHVFVIFFEYELSGKPEGKAIRVAMAQADDLGSNRTIFVGSPYSGSCFDKAIVRQFQEIADQHRPPAAKPSDPKPPEEPKK